jgi:hypothetical protein
VRGRAAKPHHDARATRRALDRLPWLPRAAALSRGSRLSWGAWRARRTAASLPRRQQQPELHVVNQTLEVVEHRGDRGREAGTC